MVKCVITGCAGFIGSNLTKACLDKGWEVIGLDNLSTGRKSLIEPFMSNPNFSFRVADITKDYLNATFERAEVVFHMAALPRVAFSTISLLQVIMLISMELLRS